MSGLDEDENIQLPDRFKSERGDRDSVDTLELLKESSDYDQERNEELIDEDDDKTLSNRSSTSEKSQKTEENIVLETNEADTSKKSSVSSSLVSINFENQLKPLPIEDSPGFSSYTINDVNLIGDNEIDTSDLVHLEPKLRDAWIKMRKLDKILANVVKKEKLVKRETQALIHKNRAELEILRLTAQHKVTKSEEENTAHFLALTYVNLDDENDKDYLTDRDSLTPLFKTQLPDSDEKSNVDKNEINNNMSSKTSYNNINETKPTNNFEAQSTATKSTKSRTNTNNTNSRSSLKTNTSKDKDKKGKNFIERNIQLVQDAGGVLAMTQEEKQRLNELLLDADDFDKDQRGIEQDKNTENSYVVEYNPYAVSLAEGDGFTPEKFESDRLKQIDSVLEKRSVFTRLASGTSRSSGLTSSLLFTKSTTNTHNIESDSYAGLLGTETKQIKLNDEFDENEFGDKFIKEVRLTREQETRLKFIDYQLDRIKNATDSANQMDSVSNIDGDSNRANSIVSLVNEDQIKQLIEEYAIENTKAMTNGNKLDTLTEEKDSDLFTNPEMGDELVEANIPYISENSIKRLLEQARNEGIFVDDSNKEENGSSTDRSFYEEALAIINSRPKLEDFITSSEIDSQEQQVPNEESQPAEPVQETHVRSSSRSRFLNSSDQYDSLLVKSNKLPPLLNTNRSIDNQNEQVENLRVSSASSVTSTNSINFPKIDSRYLPKNN